MEWLLIGGPMAAKSKNVGYSALNPTISVLTGGLGGGASRNHSYPS
jgi:hypothetical protein